MKCPDCGVDPNAEHLDGCDVARCLGTGGQRLSCEMDVRGALGLPAIEHDCGRDVWTGRWPGEAECEEFGWWCYFVPNGQPCWVPCSKDHPEAVHDLNRLLLEARWSAEQQRWVQPA